MSHHNEVAQIIKKGGGAVVYDYLNPDDMNTDYAELSENNLRITAKNTASFSWFGAARGKQVVAGNVYFEVTMRGLYSSKPSGAVGIDSIFSDLEEGGSYGFMWQHDGIGLYPYTGDVWKSINLLQFNVSNISYIGAVYGMAYRVADREFYVTDSSGNWGNNADPVARTNPIIVPEMIGKSPYVKIHVQRQDDSMSYNPGSSPWVHTSTAEALIAADYKSGVYT